MKKTLLHISNDYAGSEVHKNLVGYLSDAGFVPYLLTAIRDNNLRFKNMPPPRGVRVKHVSYKNSTLKYFPLLKVLILYNKCWHILKHEVLKSKYPAVIVAHTLWSDGLIAYFLHRKIRVPIIVMVRNTDMNIFLPKLPHYRWLVSSMLKRSKAVIFVSEAHRRRFSKRWPKLYSKIRKVKTIPNGVDPYWVDHQVMTSDYRPRRVCFVGNFLPGKNLKRLTEAVGMARNAINDLECWFIGGSHDEFLRITGLKSIPDHINVIPRVESRDELSKLYRSCRVMAMPSLRETFGLVYVEALSQGCAVICSQDEGFDGAVDDDAVKAVNPRSVEAISNAIVDLVTRYPEGIEPDNVAKITSKFAWHRVAEEYMQVIHDAQS